MAVIGTARTLQDWATTRDPNDKYAKIAELLSQDNEVLLDMPYLEGNLPTGHKTTVRTGLPASTWRAINQGVPATKGAAAPITFATAMLEQRSQVDKALAELNDDLAAYRMNEAKPHYEAMSQDMATTLFYGNEALEPEKFTGLARYYNSLSGAASSENVVSHGGSGSDQSSIYIIRWGENTIHGIYPKGSPAGLQHEDIGLDDASDASGNPFRAFKDHWVWKNGLAVRDWRAGVRVCNIDTSVIRTNDAGGVTAIKDLIRSLIIASERLRGEGSGGIMYMNRTCKTALRLGILEKVANNLSYETVAGKEVMVFDEMIVRTTDALLTTETAVS
jgi:hypothetical protein